ncbi:MAG: dihydropteroate synthase [Gemmatimonadales bacterium]
MGILNVTPDSFSDGGNFFSYEKAVEHAAEMIADGADIIDVGGESTRPGATIVEDTEEIRRVVPVIAEIRQRFPDVKISIDTTKSCVALAAIKAGADMVNDVSAFRLDSKMPEVVREAGSGVILMHSRGEIEDLASYAHAGYEGDAVVTIIEELSASAGLALSSGIAKDRIVLDPGFGFSKVSATSMELLSRLTELVAIGFPVLVGVSRKRFVTEVMLRVDDNLVGDTKSASLSIKDRDVGTEALNVVGLLNGARIFRVHNVRMARRALDAVWPIITTRTVDAD